VSRNEADEIVVSSFTPLWSTDETEVPVIDADGLLRFGGRWVALSPVQGRVLALLVAHFRSGVVSYDDLRAAAWGTSVRSPHALATLIKRLRERIEPLGLTLLTVRLRGYVLDVRPESLP
jgi:DNA-binding winged helix-turn-helix (wHTH) protein